MIIATMPERKRTIISELTIENQWICSSPMSRYVSQRDAHFTSEYSHFTSYVNTTSPGLSSASGVDGAEPPHVASCVSPFFHAPEYECLIDDGSISKPTIRAPSKDSSVWYLIVMSRWLLR